RVVAHDRVCVALDHHAVDADEHAVRLLPSVVELLLLQRDAPDRQTCVPPGGADRRDDAHGRPAARPGGALEGNALSETAVADPRSGGEGEADDRDEAGRGCEAGTGEGKSRPLGVTLDRIVAGDRATGGLSAVRPTRRQCPSRRDGGPPTVHWSRVGVTGG